VKWGTVIFHTGFGMLIAYVWRIRRQIIVSDEIYRCAWGHMTWQRRPAGKLFPSGRLNEFDVWAEKIFRVWKITGSLYASE
jgi:hypothetical protein